MIVLFMHEINHSNDSLNVLIFLRKYLAVQRQYSTGKRSSLTFSFSVSDELISRKDEADLCDSLVLFVSV